MKILTQYFGAVAFAASTLTPAYADDHASPHTIAPSFPNTAICDRSKVGRFESFAECDLTLHFAHEPVEALKDNSEIGPYVRILEQETQACHDYERDNEELLDEIFDRITLAGNTQSVLDRAVILPEELDKYILALQSKLSCVNEVSAKLETYGKTAHKPAYEVEARAISTAIDALAP